MVGHRYGACFGGRARYARGPWGRGRGGGILPYLAAAFLVRAALRRAHGGWDPGRGAWQGPHGRRGHDGPWGRGRWRHDYEHGHSRGAAWGLRSEIGPLVGLLRDAFRRGALNSRQLDEIRAVLRESRGRIAAILGETRSSSTEL